jgi:4-alpha-glucanotransferase
MPSRHAGLIVPLFSLTSSRGWGIGEIPDLAAFGAWATSAGFDRLMILPLGTLPPGVTSPYSARSTLALDPTYIALDAVHDFARAGGVDAMSPEARGRLEDAQFSRAVAYDDVRMAKREALSLAFDEFEAHEWDRATARRAELEAYVERERDWIDDYALFVAIAERLETAAWRHWPAVLRDRQPAALASARTELADPILREQYYQWLADRQWRETRQALAAVGMTIVGDMPFGVGLESPEVWARPDDYLLDASTGVPPDAFSEDGQDWGLPAYHWEAIRASGYAGLRARIRRAAVLYDGVRIDHLVGLYRTYARWPDKSAFFNPSDEPTQLRQGEEILRLFLDSGMVVLAEDLGTVPDFVRESMARLGVPGTKVQRWERAWKSPGQPYLDPRTYPPVSVAMSGTHDNEPLAVWWRELSPSDREAMLTLPLLRARLGSDPRVDWSDDVRDALIELVFSAASEEVFLPIQDILGWPDRINTPGTVGAHNWTWKLPWQVDQVTAQSTAEFTSLADTRQRAADLLHLARTYARAT